MAAGRIVFGDDGSDNADAAWRWLNRHAWPGWTVDVVRVIPAGTQPTHSEVSADPEPEAPRQAEGDSGLTVSHLRAAGDSRAVLGSVADADLLVVGTRGKGLLKALHLGSTSEWLLQAPPVPLLLVQEDRPCRTVLVCVDGSTHATAAVAALASWPWLSGVSVQVVAVDDGRTDTAAAVSSAAALLDGSGAEVTATVLPLGEELFVNVRTPLLERIQDLDADLVVSGTRGLTGLERLRVGSVATAVVHNAPAASLLASADG